MKIMTIPLITSAILGATAAAAGLGVNVVVLLSFGCTGGVVVLFIRDYSRFRRRIFRQELRRSGQRLPHRVELPPAKTRSGKFSTQTNAAPTRTAPATLH
jgi:hypothetical protein